MKRYGYLYNQIVSVENCKYAIIEAARFKHSRSYVDKVINNLDDYALDLSKRLKNLNFTSPYRPKEIEDGLSHKKRIIQVPKFYPDQCSHHAIMRVLQPIILKSSYHWSCANIKNRGIDYCSKGMERATRKGIVKYCAKMDIKKFYPSVPNEMLKEFIRTKIKDEKALKIIDQVIDSHEGLPIGNYTSPWFAEWYLQRLDHYIKEVLRIDYYIRYADDIVLMSNNKRKLQGATREIIHFCEDVLGLKIKSNYQVFPISKRKIDFIGRCYGIGYTTIRKRRALALMRQSRLLQKLQSKNCELNFHLCCSFMSRTAVFKHTDSFHMKVKYMDSVKITQLKNVIRKETKKYVENNARQ